VDWNRISRNQKLSERFIKEFADRMDWTLISMYQTLSENFIRDFGSLLNPYGLVENPNISDEIKKQLGTIFPWYSPST
jgi:hypothetical protein